MIELIKRLSAYLMVFAIGTFIACSDDDNSSQSPLTPLFSEPQKIQCEAGVTESMEFDADINWLLTSNAIWCELSTDNETFSYNVSGVSGLQKVFIRVSDEAQDFTETIAKITLTRNGQNELAAMVYRTPKGYNLQLMNSNGDKMESVAISSNGMTKFDVDANFNFGVTEYPDWLGEFTVTSDESELYKKSYKVSVLESYEPYPMTGTIMFVDEQNKVSYPYEISYSGMAPQTIEISGNGAWGWNLSSDGSLFTTNSSVSGTTTTYEGTVPYGVRCLNYDRKFVCFEEVENSLRLLSDEESWLNVTVDANDVSQVLVTGDAYPAETEGSRKAYLYAVPMAAYDNFMALFAEISDISFVDSTYNNVLMEVTQISDYVDMTTGFDVTDKDMNIIECFDESDEAILAMLNDKYAVEQVYALSVDFGTYININTKLNEERWEGWKTENVVLLDVNGNEIDKATISSYEVAMNSENEYYISFKAHSEPVIVLLKDSEGSYIKALVVKSGIVLNPGTGFDVRYLMTQTVATALETDMDIASMIIDKFNVNEIYSVTQKVGRTLYITPRLTDEEWDAGSFDATILIDVNGNTIKHADVSFEGGQDPYNNEYYYASLKVKKTPIIMIFVGRDGKNIKAMVIKPA